MANKIQLVIEADDKATPEFKRLVKGLKDGFDETDKSTKRLDRSTSSLGKTMKWAGGIAATYFGARLAVSMAKGFVRVASSFEQMEIQLDTLTKGKGKETLESLNAWAREMPVNTEEAVAAFIRMQAMGLDPTIEKMTTLVDVSSVLGEQALASVSRALGQMASLGKLSAEELNQLSEVGINARKILKDAFGMTVEELQKSEVSISQIIEAIWQGLESQYKGGSEKAMSTIQGMTVTLESYWTEFNRMISEAEGIDSIKGALGELIIAVEDLEASGVLQDWAEAIGENLALVMNAAQGVALWLRDITTSTLQDEIDALNEKRQGLKKSIEDTNVLVEDSKQKHSEEADVIFEVGQATAVLVAQRNGLIAQYDILLQKETELIAKLSEQRAKQRELQEGSIEQTDSSIEDVDRNKQARLDALAEVEETEEEAAQFFMERWRAFDKTTYESYEKRAKTADKARKKEEKSDAKHQQLMQQQSQRTAQLQIQTAMLVAQTMIAISKEESGALFYITRAFAVVQAIINAWVAYTAALAHPPGTPTTLPMAYWTLGSGLAAAALIAAQSFTGHQEGGWVAGGSGVRDDVFAGMTGNTAHMVTGGEFIVNREAAQAWAPLLEAINEGIGGGGSMQESSPGPQVTQHHITLEIDGEPFATFIKETVYEGTRSGEPVVHERGVTTI